MNNQLNHISLKKNRPRCYVKSPIAQDAFRPIPGLINCAGLVLGKITFYSHEHSTSIHRISSTSVVSKDGDYYLMHKMQSDGWPYPEGR